MFTGCGTAMVTPFRADGSLDEETLRKLVRRQIEHGIDFLVPCGTTGESPTLSHAEHMRVVAITIEEAKGRIPVLAGAGGYDTKHVIELARELETRGARRLVYTDISSDGMLAGPNVEGIRRMVEAISIPVIAAGGVSQAADVRRLATLEPLGLEGVIIGKALYTGAVRLEELL